MSAPASLCHYTITTGHVRQSPRSEMSDDVFPVLRPLLITGTHNMPASLGYIVRVTIAGSVLAATSS